MAYIPPHKRLAKDSTCPSLAPSQFQINFQNKKISTSALYCHHPKYAKHAITRWFVISENDNDDGRVLPCLLKEFLSECSICKDACRPLALVRTDHPHKGIHETITIIEKARWVSIVEKIQEDLLIAIQSARNEMGDYRHELKVPQLVFRFGKVLFHDISSIDLDNVAYTALSGTKRSFNTNLPIQPLEANLSEIVQTYGGDFDEEYEHYLVKVFEKSRPDITLTCKCFLIEDVGELVLYGIELNPMRHLAVDFSCLDKNVDLRLMISTKRTLTNLSDDEKSSLNDILKSAVVDSEVRGGLRWPPGKESVGDRYTVIGVVHNKGTIFKNSIMELKVRHADRFDFRTSTGEVTQEASLRMTELNKQLTDEKMNLNSMTDMVRDAFELVWDHYSCWEGSFS